uniref:Uncharacterized protein n=1 Tax=Ditylenchus dipsaci TaxID=166011 RepID=A0A915DG45_9BILA
MNTSSRVKTVAVESYLFVGSSHPPMLNGTSEEEFVEEEAELGLLGDDSLDWCEHRLTIEDEGILGVPTTVPTVALLGE